MKANELRIGNWVKRENENIFQVYSPLVAYHFHEVHGIPLTEQWMIKFGFSVTHYGSDVMEFIKGNISYELPDNVVLLVADDPGCFHRVEQKIMYVHQLQNLYFALTGEELTIKL